MSTDKPERSHGSETVSAPILRAISLFMPWCTDFSSLRTATGDTRLVLEPSFQLLLEREDTVTTLLLDRLVENPHSCLILASDRTSSKSSPVLGAYFPGPLWQRDDQSFEKQAVKTCSSHLLFQLLPRLHILQCTGPRISLIDIINTNSGTQTANPNTASTNIPITPYTSFTIGAPRGKVPGLRIDLETRSATLSRHAVHGEEDKWYKQVCEDTGESAGDRNWTATVERCRLDMFRGPSLADTELGGGLEAATKN